MARLIAGVGRGRNAVAMREPRPPVPDDVLVIACNDDELVSTLNASSFSAIPDPSQRIGELAGELVAACLGDDRLSPACG